MTNQNYKLHGIFPIPVYETYRESELDSTEKKEIGKIIKEGMKRNPINSSSNNSDIFNGKLKKLKQFCEEHIRIYAKEVINPEEKLDFYITQSWLNVNKPGEGHHDHFHSNSIISGVFYIFTEKDDTITFSDPNFKVKEIIKLEQKELNPFNSVNWTFSSNNNELLLFPSWLNHQVKVNEKATIDRISISFNTFVSGTLGKRKYSTELIIK